MLYQRVEVGKDENIYGYYMFSARITRFVPFLPKVIWCDNWGMYNVLLNFQFELTLSLIALYLYSFLISFCKCDAKDFAGMYVYEFVYFVM